jgi:RNA polymerase sigma factor (sigma-70 family)
MSIVQQEQATHAATIACAQAGCKVCVEALLKQHANLVVVIVQRQWTGEADYADLIQEGRIGLWRAIQGFDPGRGYAFSSYAAKVIQHRVWLTVERSLRVQGWQEQEAAQDRLSEIVMNWQTEQVRAALLEEIACLPKRIGCILEKAYGLNGEEPQSLAAIGRQIGLTRERIRQLHNDGLVLLRMPSLSLRLRGLYEQNNRRGYRQSLKTNAAWVGRRRGRR